MYFIYVYDIMNLLLKKFIVNNERRVMNYFIDGLLLGFAYVAPIGMQNLFMINTALTQSKLRTYLTAIIITFFDITLAFACFYGIGAIMSATSWLQIIILAIGSLVVLWIGFSIFKSEVSLENTTDVNIPIKQVITTACVVTWFNPQAIIDGSLMLGAFKASIPTANLAIIFIIGVSFASATWWFSIATLGRIFNKYINEKALKIINMVCGTVIMYYGIKLFISFIQMILNI